MCTTTLVRYVVIAVCGMFQDRCLRWTRKTAACLDGYGRWFLVSWAGRAAVNDELLRRGQSVNNAVSQFPVKRLLVVGRGPRYPGRHRRRVRLDRLPSVRPVPRRPRHDSDERRLSSPCWRDGDDDDAVFVVWIQLSPRRLHGHVVGLSYQRRRCLHATIWHRYCFFDFRIFCEKVLVVTSSDVAKDLGLEEKDKDL